MAGSALAGFANASELLFAGRTWLLTPHRKHALEPLKRLQRLIESIGARPALMTADEHDRVIAAVSHVPQILALALSLSVAGRGQGIAGPALIEMTRLADSPAAMWAELVRGRNGAVIQELQRLRTYLTQFEMALTFGDPLEGWFQRAAARRKDILPL
jgi:prephenate dehydrogenase